MIYSDLEHSTPSSTTVSAMELTHSDVHGPQPMSRTHQYRKVMKPLLERKRRARINRCLDELKDLMVNALQTEGESITKLEKADVLELTVRHLRKLKKHNALGLTPQATYAGRFKAGYAHCAQEVSKFMSSPTSAPVPVDAHVSARLISHLNGCIQALDMVPPSAISTAPASPPAPPPPTQPAMASPSESLDEDGALDLSRGPRRDSSSPVRSRQLSDDSDDSGCKSSSFSSSSVGGEEGSKKGISPLEDKNSWRPW